MELMALIRMISLAYVLGLISLIIVRLLWRPLRLKLAPALRADTGFAILTGVFLLNAALGVMIWLGVTQGVIRMTTNYFHFLMHGPWALVIMFSGLLLFAISLLIVVWNWRRGYVPRDTAAATIEFSGHTLRESGAVPTLSLVGAWQPELWVNKEYWEGLSDSQRQLALYHEKIHHKRNDNRKRLVIGFITGMFAVVPGIRSWLWDYELDSELAVDYSCCQHLPKEEYTALVLEAAKHSLSWQSTVVASHFTPEQFQQRLAALKNQGAAPPVLISIVLGYVAVILSVTPSVVVLFHPLSRCLCACYLGY